MAGAGPNDHVLLALAKRDKSDLGSTMQAVTEASAAVLGVARSGIWSLAEDESRLVLEDLYVRGEGRHEVGDVVLADPHPAYFAALRERRTITADEARSDPRTVELRDRYLDRHGILSMMDVPIWHRARLYGVLCNEDSAARRWEPQEVAFATNLADIVSLSLEASERRCVERSWAAVVDAIGEAVFVVDETGRLEPANAKMRDLLATWGGGVTREERARLFEVVDLLGTPVPAAERSGIRALAGEPANGEVFGLRRLADGESSYYRVTLTPTGPPDQPPRRCVGVLVDLSEDVRFAQLKRRFLDDVAHELKTPVAIVKGYTHVLCRSPDLPVRHLESLAAIQRAAERMAGLVHGVVEVSGIVLGRLVLARTRVSLGAVAVAVRDRLEVEAPLSTVDVRVAEEVEAIGDPARLELAIHELVLPLVRAGTGGIELEVTREGERAVFEVRAHGRPPIADGATDTAGGLTSGVFREIVRAHDGQVAVFAGEDRTTIRISLPAADER